MKFEVLSIYLHEINIFQPLGTTLFEYGMVRLFVHLIGEIDD